MDPQKRMRVTSRHWDLLLGILEEHPEMVTGKFICQNAKMQSTILWQDAANKLNALGLGEKSPDKWKLALQDWKYKTKTKISEIKEHEKKTGGGPPTKVKLNEQEERLMNIVGWTAVLGNVNVPESGLGQNPLAPKPGKSEAESSITYSVQELQFPINILDVDANVENVKPKETVVVTLVEDSVEDKQSSMPNKKQKTENYSKRKNTNTDDILGVYHSETMEVLREISTGIRNLSEELKSISQSLKK